MKTIIRILSVVITFFSLWSCSAPRFAVPELSKEEKNVRDALASKDVGKLLRLYNENVKSRSLVEDVFCSSIDLNSYDYEDICSFSNNIAAGTPMEKRLQNIRTEKESQILSNVSPLTAEQLRTYINNYPKRVGLVKDFVNESLDGNKSSLSYLELYYLTTELEGIVDHSLVSECNNRTDEIRGILASDFDSYVSDESELLKQLDYALEKKTMEYFYSRCEKVAECYSKIGMVPDQSSEAASQFRKLVNKCFSSSELKSILQKEIDAYCSEVNKARGKYVERLGKDFSYKKLKLSAPSYSFDYSVSMEPFRKIYGKRQEMMESRQNSKKAKGIARFLGVGLLANIVQGGFDLFKVSEVADNEVECREAYMSSVFSEMEKNVKSQKAATIKAVESASSENLKQFKKSVIKK